MLRHGLGSLPAEGKAEQVNDKKSFVNAVHYGTSVTDDKEVVLVIKTAKESPVRVSNLGTTDH